MKTNIIKHIAAVSLGVLLMTGCQTTEEQSLKLSTVMVPFSYKGGSEIVEVVMEGSDVKSWDVDYAPEDKEKTWVTLGEKNSSSIVINVIANTEYLERRAKFVFKSGAITRELTVVQMPFEDNIARYRNLGAFNDSGISPNGKYAAGFITDVDPITDKYLFYPVIIDVEKDKWHTLDPIPESEFSLDYVGAVTNKGEVFYDADGEGLMIDLAGNRQKLAPMSGFKFAPVIQQVSEDGNTWVGYTVKKSVDGEMTEDYSKFEYGYWPILYKNGIATALERPSKSVKGDYNWGGALARGVSANGEVIYGGGYGGDQHGDHSEAMWWKNGKVAYVGQSNDNSEIDGWKKNVVEIKSAEGSWNDKPFTFHYGNYVQCTSESYNASPSGKYIAFTYVEEEMSGDDVKIARTFPAFFNTENETVLVIRELLGYHATTVTDDGIGFVTRGGGEGGAASGGVVVDVNNKGAIIEQSVDSWIKKNYDGLTIPGNGSLILHYNPTSKIVYGISNGSNAMNMGESTGFYVAPKE